MHVNGCRRLFASLFFAGFVAIVLTTGNSQTPFAIQSIEPTNGAGYTIRWTTPAGLPNRVRYADSLDSPWQDLPCAAFLPSAVDTNFSFTDSTATNVAQRFYRIRGGRNQVMLSLVLDRSASMQSMPIGNGGMTILKLAVPLFIDHFDDRLDRASLISFACAARIDVPMTQPFTTTIISNVNALVADGWTASDAGLEKARQQNHNVSINPGETVLKIIVFVTDGLANTFQYYPLQCWEGTVTNNISPNSGTWDPDQDCGGTACTFPPCLVSIDPSIGCVNRANDCPEGDRSKGLYAEAEARALAVAKQARLEGNMIYAVGLGDPNNRGECGRPTINPYFLTSVTNDPSSFTYDPSQPAGMAIIVSDASQLSSALAQVAADILSRSF
jgi:hypothetical protein